MSKLLRTFLLAFALMIAMCASAFAAPPVDVEFAPSRTAFDERADDAGFQPPV